MKKISLRSLFFLFTLTASQIGCWLPDTSSPSLAEADKLRLKARSFMYNGKLDSAIIYYHESLYKFNRDIWWYRYHDSLQDTTVSVFICEIYHNLGGIYDSLKDYDKSVAYFTQALKWNASPDEHFLRIEDEKSLGYDYLLLGKKCGPESNQQKDFYLKAESHIVASCNYVDNYSSQNTQYALSTYKTAVELYTELNDKTKESYFENKYNELYSKLKGSL